MKVLMTGWGFPPDIDGGLDVHVAELFRELRDMEGVEIDLALPEDRAPGIGGVIPVETGNGDMVQQARSLSQEVAELSEDYDIVHTHDWLGAEAGFKARKYSGCGWISTFHSLSDERTRGGSERIERMEQVAAEESDVCIAVSESLKEKVSERYGADPEVIHNGYRKPETHGKDVRESLGIEEDMILYVGRHAEQKNIELLLRAFEKLGRGTLVIGGEGHMTDALKEFADLLGIEDSVEFVGYVPDSELGDFYASADVFVSPSRSEPFGLTIAEAACCGTPVVSTESGCLELLPEESYFLSDRNSDALADNIDKALESEVEPVEEKSWSGVAEQTLELYQEIS